MPRRRLQHRLPRRLPRRPSPHARPFRASRRSAGALAPLRSRLARCDKRLQELSLLATSLDEQLADPALYGAGAKARQQELNTQRARVAQETGEVEGEWLEISEELERVQAAG